jgi:replication-associated recombination protein RarA
MEWDLLTQNSCNGPEVISALQKHIRRGEEVEALKCAYELVPKYEKWLWRRLIVIALEDIGPANPNLHVQVRALRDTYFEFRQEDKRGSEVLVLSNVILLMCRSPKSRIGDEFGCYCMKQWKDEKGVKIPDYALDGHTARGKQLGRGMPFFLEESAKLVPEPTDHNPYKKQAEEYWLGGFRGGPVGSPLGKNGKEKPQGDLF